MIPETLLQSRPKNMDKGTLAGGLTASSSTKRSNIQTASERMTATTKIEEAPVPTLTPGDQNMTGRGASRPEFGTDHEENPPTESSSPEVTSWTARQPGLDQRRSPTDGKVDLESCVKDPLMSGDPGAEV